MRTLLPLLALIAFGSAPLWTAELEAKPPGEQFAKFKPVKAPSYISLYLKEGDRLAIIAIRSPNRRCTRASSKPTSPLRCQS